MFNDASFDGRDGGEGAAQTNPGVADQIRRYKDKVADVLNNSDGITAKELKKCQDLSPYRDWFIQLLKYTNKLHQEIDSGLIDQLNQVQHSQARLQEAMMKNEELEQKIERIRRGGQDKHNSIGSDGEENDNSFIDGGGYAQTEAEAQSNQILIQSLQ